MFSHVGEVGRRVKDHKTHNCMKDPRMHIYRCTLSLLKGLPTDIVALLQFGQKIIQFEGDEIFGN